MTKHGKSRTHRILPALPGILDSIALLALVWLASGLWFQSRFQRSVDIGSPITALRGDRRSLVT